MRTVADLIEELKKYPQDEEFYGTGPDGLINENWYIDRVKLSDVAEAYTKEEKEKHVVTFNFW